jgi:hypothetical protein
LGIGRGRRGGPQGGRAGGYGGIGTEIQEELHRGASLENYIAPGYQQEEEEDSVERARGWARVQRVGFTYIVNRNILHSYYLSSTPWYREVNVNAIFNIIVEDVPPRSRVS